MADKMNWKIVQIQDIAQVIRGASPRPKGDKRYYGGNVPRLMVEDVTRDGKYVYPSVDFLTEEGAKLSRPCKAGTLTIVCSGTVGVPSILGVDACIHDGFLGLIKVSSTVSTDYLYHFFCTQRDKFNNSATHGGVFTNLTTDGVKAFEVSLPIHLEEQEKIATALSDTDALISELEKLIEKKQAIKTATMQQLLTGKTRLPEFALREDGMPKAYKESELGPIPEDWGIVPFRECVDIPQGQVNPINEPYASMILVGPKHIESGTGKLLFVETANEQQAISGKYLFEEGDVLYGKINPYLMKAALVNFKGLCSADMYPLRPKGNIKSGLLLALILGEDFTKYAVSVSARSGMPKINRNELAQYKFCLPKDLEEQEQIANILLSIDVGLESLNTHLNKINNIKKGMMQELLTGKTRLV